MDADVVVPVVGFGRHAHERVGDLVPDVRVHLAAEGRDSGQTDVDPLSVVSPPKMTMLLSSSVTARVPGRPDGAVVSSVSKAPACASQRLTVSKTIGEAASGVTFPEPPKT